jgi:hypothetical protein
MSSFLSVSHHICLWKGYGRAKGMELLVERAGQDEEK